MIRAALSVLLCAAVLAVGAATAGVQVQNFEDAAELDAIAVEAEERLGGKHFVTQFARRLLLARDAEARLLAAGPGAMAALGADLVARAASCEAYLVECQEGDVAGR